MPEVYHVPGLHMHQPPGNLVALHNSSERWEAKQILWCYDRPTRMIEGYEDVARLHRSFDDLEQVCHLPDTAMAKLPNHEGKTTDEPG